MGPSERKAQGRWNLQTWNLAPRKKVAARSQRSGKSGYFLRWRILARIRRFLRPIFLRPLPVRLVPTNNNSRFWIVDPCWSAKNMNQRASQYIRSSWKVKVLSCARNLLGGGPGNRGALFRFRLRFTANGVNGACVRFAHFPDGWAAAGFWGRASGSSVASSSSAASFSSAAHNVRSDG